MFRNSMLCLLLLSVVSGLFAQSNLQVEGVTPNLRLGHTVSAKETWYSISRMYNLPPKEIAEYNKVSIDMPLEIGQRIHVPLVAANFSQNDIKAPGEVFVPVYHTIQEKEWMYRISVNYNKVPIENLEKWNSINRDQAKAGLQLIVGYLKVREPNAALAAKGNAAVSEVAAPEKAAAPRKEPVTKPDLPSTGAEQPAQPKPAPVKQGQANMQGGYFKGQFDEGGKNISGLSGIFKSASGWKDGKYYALMNKVGIGSIIKITYSQTNKSVFAKVLGELPEMKESDGLSLRISDAAANELGAVNSKFSVEVAY